MVRVREALPRDAEGSVEEDVWLASVALEHEELDAELLGRVLAHMRERNLPVPLREAGLDIAQMLLELQFDQDALVIGLVYRAWRSQALTREDLNPFLGAEGLQLLAALDRVEQAHELNRQNPPMLRSGHEEQIENVRLLLESLIDDVRVALIKLCERVAVLRMAKDREQARREELAQESLDLFAPLAGRLGLWRIKWALEDLAFRYLEPATYQQLARALDGKREERERRVAELVVDLRRMLETAGIDADVSGRAKHLYSIWRKMRAKGVEIDRIYDARALRVLVRDADACYRALGVIHAAWQHLPDEFDDYIANPKENGYQSLHTAVIGPNGDTLEVQIRTHAMHEEAEFGVCAHWSYKEPQRRMANDRVGWLRQILEWHDDGGGPYATLLQGNFHDQRIYVSTPEGHVLDLPRGATAVDFAYRVHTQIGHSARGALVDGRPTRLSTPLQTGQRVAISTGSEQRPLRVWLDEHHGFVVTTRARSKIQGWFRRLPPGELELLGRRLWHGICRRLNCDPRVTDLMASSGFVSDSELFRALGCGDCSTLEMAALLQDAREDALGDAIVVRARNVTGLLARLANLFSDQQVELASTRAELMGEHENVEFEFGLQTTNGSTAPLATILALLERIERLRAVLSARLQCTQTGGSEG
ncbi:MAG: HD domain-containing protein [Pseudomonadota bacterium]